MSNAWGNRQPIHLEGTHHLAQSRKSNEMKIAVIPGDGIGHEVVPEGLKVLEAAGRRFDLAFDFTDYDWSCERFHKTGAMMPEDGLEQIRDSDAVFLGAVGFPGVPDHVSLWGLLIPIRREFHQYINLRPVRLFDGLPCRFGLDTAGMHDVFERHLHALPALVSIHRVVAPRYRADASAAFVQQALEPGKI